MNVLTTGKPRGRRREAGFTLAEMLIAMAIFIIAATVAFLLYDNAQQAFKKGEEATEQQQVTRVAFDKLLADLRTAGYNYNPTGNPSLTDEQIEGAWPLALVIRADFDAEDPTKNTTPESTLDDSPCPFGVVSTGNDEIVAYALAKNAGNVGGNTLSFWADKSSPRDITADQIDVNNVALTAQSDPPYTLYRITFDASGAAVKEPLADNIRSLAFTYYDAIGGVIDPATVTLGGADTTVARTNRARIRRVTVDVVGMTPNNDIRYLDAADSDPDTQRRRKFHLVSDVQPRNLGMVGAADPDNVPPSIPTGLAACVGHCGGLVLTWNENDASQAVVQYNIKYGTSAGAMNSQTSFSEPPGYIGGLSDTSSYYFTIQAQDTSGNTSPWSSTVVGPVALASNTFPLQVQGLAASSSTKVDLSWTSVTQNTDAGASATSGGCDPGKPARRDNGGYKVYRKVNPSGTPFDTSATLSNADVSFVASGTTYTDTSGVLCTPYGYRITAVDGECTPANEREGAPSSMVTASTAPVAMLKSPTNGYAQVVSGNHANLSWDPVTEDTATPPNTLAVDTYILKRALVDTSQGQSETNDALYSVVTSGLTWFTPTSVQHVNGGSGANATTTIWYKVAADTNCGGSFDIGEWSDPFQMGCDFSGSPTIATPSNGASVVAGYLTLGLNVSGGSSTYTQTAFTATPVPTGTAVSISPDTSWRSPATSPQYDHAVTWDARTLSGQYRIDAVTTQADNCTRSASPVTITLEGPASCCLAVTSANIITQGANKKELRITFNNFCNVDLSVDQVTVRMTTDAVNTDSKLSHADFDNVTDIFDDASGVVIEGVTYPITISPVEVLNGGSHFLDLEFKSNITNCTSTYNEFDVNIRYTRPETGTDPYTCAINTQSYVVTCI